jgi:tRNA(Arg) A34 adenosine deaminase TadA
MLSFHPSVSLLPKSKRICIEAAVNMAIIGLENNEIFNYKYIPKSKHGSVLVYNKNKIIGKAWNNIYRSRICNNNVLSTHAEIGAIRMYNKIKVKKVKKKIDLYVVRIAFNENNILNLKESKPCVECLAACLQFGIDKIWWSTDEGKIECSKTEKLITNYKSYSQKQKKYKINKIWNF